MLKRYIKIFDIDGEKYIRCPITGQRQLVLKCQDCEDMIKLNPVKKQIVCKIQTTEKNNIVLLQNLK